MSKCFDKGQTTAGDSTGPVGLAASGLSERNRVRRETARAYLTAAGNRGEAVQSLGRRRPSKLVNEVRSDSGPSADAARQPTASRCEASPSSSNSFFAKRQNSVVDHRFTGRYAGAMWFVRQLRRGSAVGTPRRHSALRTRRRNSITMPGRWCTTSARADTAGLASSCSSSASAARRSAFWSGNPTHACGLSATNAPSPHARRRSAPPRAGQSGKRRPQARHLGSHGQSRCADLSAHYGNAAM